VVEKVGENTFNILGLNNFPAIFISNNTPMKINSKIDFDKQVKK